jgi:hypothetical protein
MKYLTNASRLHGTMSRVVAAEAEHVVVVEYGCGLVIELSKYQKKKKKKRRKSD